MLGSYCFAVNMQISIIFIISAKMEGVLWEYLQELGILHSRRFVILFKAGGMSFIFGLTFHLCATSMTDQLNSPSPTFPSLAVEKLNNLGVFEQTTERVLTAHLPANNSEGFLNLIS